MAKRKYPSTKKKADHKLLVPKLLQGFLNTTFVRKINISRVISSLYRPHFSVAKTKKFVGGMVASRRAMLILFASTMLVANMFATKNSGPTSEAQVLSSTITSAHDSSWCEVCRIEQISIPSVIFLDKKIAQMNFDVLNKTWPTPISGIATPKETIPNNIIVFGHSKWFGRQSHFSRISMLKVGDEIFVTDQFDKTHTFTVASLDLVDRFNGDAVHAKQNLQLTLLTSARNNGEWLLPTHIDKSATDHVQDDKKYAIFIVTAVPKK